MLVNRKESTKIDQNGQRILPKKKMAIPKTSKKYLSRIELGGIEAFGLPGIIGLILFPKRARKRLQ